jgi:hypothetical protein
MRPNTSLWLRLESVGYPELTTVTLGTVHEHVMEIAKWMLKTKLGSRIQITMARNESELITGGKQRADFASLEDGLNEIMQANCNHEYAPEMVNGNKVCSNCFKTIVERV